MIYSNNKRRSRGRRSSSGDADSDLPPDESFGYGEAAGFSEEGRFVRVVDAALDDAVPTAFDPKGETTTVNLAERPAQRVCQPGSHVFEELHGPVSDIPGTVEKKCRYCGVGHYERIK